MGWIQELIDLFGTLRFADIVTEYQQGLHFRKGVALEKRIRGFEKKYQRRESLQKSPQKAETDYKKELPLTEDESKKEIIPQAEETKSEQQKSDGEYKTDLVTKAEDSKKELTQKTDVDSKQLLKAETAKKESPKKIYLETILEEEKKVIKEAGGYLKFLPFRRPHLPDGYKKSFYTGLPLHPKRFSKNLEAGLYFFIPIIDHFVKDSVQERVDNLGYITVLTADDEPKMIAISCNIRFKLVDFYKAYTAVDDYKNSLKDYTLSILAVQAREKHYSDWKKAKKIEEIEKRVNEEVEKVVKKGWGLDIIKIYITDIVVCQGIKIVADPTTQTSNVTPLPNLNITERLYSAQQ